MAKIGLSAPWVTYYRKVNALFKDDPEVMVVYDEIENNMKIYVEEAAKAEAIGTLLPHQMVYGNVTMKITVVPANEDAVGIGEDLADLLAIAFEGNPALSYVRRIRGVFTNNITYIVFRNRVVQFFNDDLGDINGMCSTLYQDIAKDVFGEHEGVFFCTDVEHPVLSRTTSLGKPLGEWP